MPLAPGVAPDPCAVQPVLPVGDALQVLRVVVPLVPVFVVYLHPIRDVAVVHQVDDAVGVDVAAGLP